MLARADYHEIKNEAGTVPIFSNQTSRCLSHSLQPHCDTGNTTDGLTDPFKTIWEAGYRQVLEGSRARCSSRTANKQSGFRLPGHRHQSLVSNPDVYTNKSADSL